MQRGVPVGGGRKCGVASRGSGLRSIHRPMMDVARRSRWAAVFTSAGLAVALFGCDTKEPAPSGPEPPASAAKNESDPHGMNHGPSPHEAAQGKAALPPAEIVWEKPGAWKEMPARMMRKATYQAPGEAGPAEVAVFYFGPGQGGGVEANISRWVGQFQDLPKGEARRDQLQVNGYQVYTVRVQKGTFSAGMPGAPATPQEDWGMNAAVVEAPSGAYFFKMTGPAQTVTAEEGNFLALLKSVKEKG